MPARIVYGVLSSAELAKRPDFSVSKVSCHADHPNWSVEQPSADVRLVLVRTGRFRRRFRGDTVDLDRTVGYLAVPAGEEGFAHPAGGDVCTSISMVPELWRALAGDAPRLSATAVHIDGRLDLGHRRLLRAAQTDAGYAGAESLVHLVGEIVHRIIATTVPAVEASSAGDHALVAAARAAIVDDHPAAAGLMSLAAQLDVSPYRLSRAFPRVLGVTLTRYRNQVRVARALDRIEAGESSLAAIAADIGFADQAHLTRTVRDHVGSTPAALRDLLLRDQGRDRVRTVVSG